MNRRPGHRVQMRWRDLDGLGHVNHTVVLTYLEEGRDAFFKQHGVRRDEYVVGRCSVSFHGEIDPAFESVTVHCAVRDLGRSSLTTTSHRWIWTRSRSASRSTDHSRAPCPATSRAPSKYTWRNWSPKPSMVAGRCSSS